MVEEKGQRKMLDLRAGPNELKNVYHEPGPQQAVDQLKLKTARIRLTKELRDDDPFANGPTPDQQPIHPRASDRRPNR